jgi:hypothetical protein
MQQEVQTKRKQTYLTNTDMWKVATFLIESRCIVQDPVTKAFTLWRVPKIISCQEVNNDTSLNIPTITPHHLAKSLEFYNEIAILTNNLPDVPPIQDTVKEDMLAAEVSKLKDKITSLQAIIEEYKLSISKAVGILSPKKEPLSPYVDNSFHPRIRTMVK